MTPLGSPILDPPVAKATSSLKGGLGVVFALAAVCLLLCCPALAQSQFPFVIPWNDATHTDVDVSSLNSAPAGANGFIVVKDGHFVESKTGKRIRFLGVNFAGAAAFPDHDDAAQVAARLAKYGVNLVRLHHMDNPWGIGNGASIWDASYKDRQHIDPQQLDKLDYLIYQLKQHGIYVNINLHVSRQFTPADGFPESVNHLPEDYDKRVDEFDSRMIQLQKNYARDLLTHVNPYTHLAYVSDPCVLNVELNNENSLVGEPWNTLGAGLDNLPQPFSGELQGLWNKWLAAKYPTSKGLETAWLAGTTPPGANILKPTADSANWFLEKNNPGVAGDLATDGPVLQADITHVDGTAWHMQLDQTGLDIKNGGTYTVTFRAKADAPRDLNVYAGLDESDWHHIGLDTTAHLTTDWQTFTYTFDASDTAPSHNRLTFVLGNQTGKVWLSDVTLSPGASGLKLVEGETLAARDIVIPSDPVRAQKADWLAFLADTERDYAVGMRDYLKNDLHLHALVVCSQVSWGGLSGVYRENAMDFADNHAYWQHPQFPGKPWDSVNWRIDNTSMVPALGKGDTLTDLAEYRIAGKPYSVSEYNHPAPNDYQSECVPLYASFAAFQDWDTIYLFDYGDYGKKADNSKIQSYFGVGPNPAKWAFMPAAAMIFREGAVAPAQSMAPAGIPKSFTGAYFASHLTTSAAMSDAGAESQDAFSKRVAVSLKLSTGPLLGNFAGGQLMKFPPPSTLITQTLDPKTAHYTADSDEAKVVVGFVGGQTINFPGMAGPIGGRAVPTNASFTFGTMPDNFASLTLTSMDGKPLTSSSKALLTIADRVDNTGMVWNAAHDSVNDHWGTDPTIADGVPVTVTLTTNGPRKVFAVDGTGEQTKLVPSTYAGGKLTFSAGPEYKTLWYAIVK